MNPVECSNALYESKHMLDGAGLMALLNWGLEEVHKTAITFLPHRYSSQHSPKHTIPLPTGPPSLTRRRPQTNPKRTILARADTNIIRIAMSMAIPHSEAMREAALRAEDLARGAGLEGAGLQGGGSAADGAHVREAVGFEAAGVEAEDIRVFLVGGGSLLLEGGLGC